jgi:transposase
MHYGAIDLHATYTWIRIVTAEDEVVFDKKVPTTRASLHDIFRRQAPARILIESSTESEWVAQVIEACGHEAVVVAPGYALMYGHRDKQIKTDHRDVVALTVANRHGIYRRAHRVSAEQRRRRQALRVREQLVRARTQLINLLRAQLRQDGYRLPSGKAETVPRRYAALPVEACLSAALAPLITTLETLTAQIAACEADLQRLAQSDSVVRQLMTAPGVGPITALTYRAQLDAVTRFASARNVAAYLGLVPREDSSGAQRRRGGITKAGPRSLRALLVQASWVIWRQRGGALHAWVHRLADRRGKRIAIVALARRLGRILYAMWRSGTDYREQPAAA